jgi:hypothetical protein
MKQLVILTCYINRGDNIPEMTRIKILKNAKDSIDKTFNSDLENETGIIIKTLIIPVTNQETKIECIYPKLTDEKILEKLGDLENRVNDFFKNRRICLSKKNKL